MTTATIPRRPDITGTQVASQDGLVITHKAEPSWVDIMQAIHGCPVELQACLALYYISLAMKVDLTWPTCLSCKRCLVEPSIWRFPLEPHRNLLCAPCLNAAAFPSNNYMAFASEEYLRRDWLIKEVSSGREPMQPYPGEAPLHRPKGREPFRHDQGGSAGGGRCRPVHGPAAGGPGQIKGLLSTTQGIYPKLPYLDGEGHMAVLWRLRHGRGCDQVGRAVV